MNDRIDLTYFAYGNRDFECLKQASKNVKPSASVKSSASNLIERNYLDFDPGIIKNNFSSVNTTDEKIKIPKKNKYNFSHSSSEPNFEVDPQIFNKYHPEYKIYRTNNEQLKELNNYLYPVGQYLYKDNPKIKTVEKLFCLQKSRKNILAAEEENKKYSSTGNSNRENNNYIKDQKIILKNPPNNNILVPNDFHIKNNNSLPKISHYNESPEQKIENLKYGSFLESKQAPEYLRNYDKESLKNIDQYYLNKNENIHVLSRFGNWITLKPNDKNRSHALEKIKHGTNETSIVAPVWMDIASRRNNINNKEYELGKKAFKCVQHNNSVRDNTKVTLLMDRDQENVKPLFLRDTYEKNKILFNQTNM